MNRQAQESPPPTKAFRILIGCHLIIKEQIGLISQSFLLLYVKKAFLPDSNLLSAQKKSMMEIKIIILGSAYLISALLKIDLHYFSQRCKKPFMDEYSMHRLEGSQISLMSDKRLLVAKIIELTFGQNDLMTFSDFRTHGRLLCDLIFT